MAITGAVVGAGPAQAVGESLSGVVTDADTGLPIPDVRVEAYNQAAATIIWDHTDVNGYYHFDSVPADGDYTLYANTHLTPGSYAGVYHPGTPFFNQATTFSLTNSSGLVVNMALNVGGSISGSISYEASAQSIYIDVRAYNPDDSSWQTLKSAETFGATSWSVEKLPVGYYKVRYTDLDAAEPNYVAHHYNRVRQERDGELIRVVAGADRGGVDTVMTVNDPSNVVRLAGQDRFATSARIAQEFSEANVLFVANGFGYPDALSAAPAAAYLNAPLLLTRKDSLPAVIKEQIQRLNPDTIYVVGGTGVISASVFNQLNALAGDSAQRLAGSNRYTTSQAVFSTIWDGATAELVFLADGRNFPDALASASSAAYTDGPVVLVNGGSSSLPSGLSTLLQSANTTDVVIAGGPAVVSSGIEAAPGGLSGIDAHRYFGANRYATSFEINNHFFGSTKTVFLAVGTGYADALAGAALAGAQSAPLYIIPGNCIPQDVLNNIDSLADSRIVLLGGTGVLSMAVENLTSCNPAS